MLKVFVLRKPVSVMVILQPSQFIINYNPTIQSYITQSV
jgi:hypothetical protein